MIAVTFALPAESSNFLKLLRNPIRGRIGHAEFTCGSIGGKQVCVLHTGVGEKATRPRIADFLEHQKTALLISAGFAGALADELHVGDLVLADNFTAPHLLAPTRDTLGTQLHVGTLATSGAVIDSVSERVELRERSGAIAVDMETEWIANACRTANVPMISLRVISDTPAAPMPAPADVLFNVARQKTDVGTLSSYVARHPGALWRLASFGKRITLARHVLAGAIVRLIERDSADTPVA